MKEIQLNAEASVSLEVTDDNTAVAAGSGSLRVLGTPFMIALMEKPPAMRCTNSWNSAKPPLAPAFPFPTIRQAE